MESTSKKTQVVTDIADARLVMEHFSVRPFMPICIAFYIWVDDVLFRQTWMFVLYASPLDSNESLQSRGPLAKQLAAEVALPLLSSGITTRRRSVSFFLNSGHVPHTG